MKNKMILFVVLALILSACNLPGRTTTPPSDLVATQVAIALTSMPTATQAPSPLVSTATQPAPTATIPVEPTATLTLTAAPSTTSTTLPTITAIATISAGDPRANLGSPTWERISFEVGKDFGYFDNPEIRVEVKNSLLVMTALKADKFLGWTLTYPTPKNFYLETTLKTSDCSGLDRYGLVLRASDYTDAKGYFLGFSCDGQYELLTWDGSILYEVQTWKPAPGLRAGSNQTNRIGVMVNGNKLTVYANGGLVGEINDSTYPDAGRFGFFFSSANTAGFNVTLSDIAYWEIK